MVSNCPDCGIEVNAFPIECLGLMLRPRCHLCSEQRNGEATLEVERRELAVRLETWRNRCEAQFQSYNIHHPGVDQALAQVVLNWQPSPKGIGLVGDGDTGKTRLIWALLKNLHLRGLPWKAISATELGRLYGDSFEERARARAEEDRLCNVQILFIDDIGKERTGPASDAISERFFHVLDRRYARKLPVLWTSNFRDPKAWVTKLGERGDSTLRRLNEVSEVYVVTRRHRRGQKAITTIKKAA